MKSLTTAALILTSQTLMAADWRQAEQYAKCLKSESARACREIYIGMRHDRDFPMVYRTAYDLYTLSAHLLDTVCERDGMDHVWEDLREVDDQFHALEAMLEKCGWCGARTRTSSVGCRVASRSRDFHLRRLEGHIAMFDKGLHELIDEVDYVPLPDGGGVVQPPVVLPPPVPTAPTTRPTIGRPTRFVPSGPISSGPRFDRVRHVSVPLGKSGFRLNLVLR